MVHCFGSKPLILGDIWEKMKISSSRMCSIKTMVLRMAFRIIGAASFIVMDLLIMNTSALRMRHTISPLKMDINHSEAA